MKRLCSLLRLVHVAVLASGVLAISACSDSPSRPEIPDVPAVANVVVDTTAGPIFRTLAIELETAAAVEVDYWSLESPRLRVTASKSALTHTVFLPRLRSETLYAYQVRALGSQGELGQPRYGYFTTDSLPGDLASVRFTAEGRPSLPLTVLEFIGRGSFAGIVIVDQDGEVVWYRRTVGVAAGFARRGNGNFVILDYTEGLFETTPDWQVVSTLPQEPNGRFIHHDIIRTPQDRILFIANDPRTINDTVVVGDAIWEWDPDQNVLSKRWSSFDFLSWTEDRGPRTRPSDWLHANSLYIGPRGNVLISLRYTNQVISIAPDYQSLEWRLSGPGGMFELGDDASFWGQHSAAEVAPGRILVFDNGVNRPGGVLYSRAVEVELNRSTGSARKVWEFRPQPDNFSFGLGATRRLENGNTMVTFGLRAGLAGSYGPIEVYEVSPQSEIVWQLQIEFEAGGIGVYRATPVPDVAGEWDVQ